MFKLSIILKKILKKLNLFFASILESMFKINKEYYKYYKTNKEYYKYYKYH